MARTKIVDLGIERRVAIGMIGSDDFARMVKASGVRMELKSPHVRQLCKWSMDYCKEYDEAPKAHIRDIFESKVKLGEVSDEDAELLGDLLSGISAEASKTKFNHRYVFDEAMIHFKRNALAGLHKDLKTALDVGDVSAAEEILSKQRAAEGRPARGFVDPIRDVEVVRSAFEVDNQPLFTLRGALGHLMNKQLKRDSLIGVQAPEKRGKTWFLMELAYRALMARCNVALFEVGDMSESQITRRLHIRMAGRSDDPDHCGRVFVPCMDCQRNQDGSCADREGSGKVVTKDDDGKAATVPFDEAPKDYKPCVKCRGQAGRFRAAVWGRYEDMGGKALDWQDAVRNGRRVATWLTNRSLRLSVHPNSSINVSGIEGMLDMAETNDGWTPDVVVIDYADILAPERGCKDERPQNETWKALRALSQRRHILVITATQADADSYDAHTQKLRNFSEDKRKYAHSTVTYSLNQTEREKLANVMRVGVLVQREGRYTSDSKATVLQCLERGRFFIDSF